MFAGDINWVTVGKGIMHNEIAASFDEDFVAI